MAKLVCDDVGKNVPPDEGGIRDGGVLDATVERIGSMRVEIRLADDAVAIPPTRVLRSRVDWCVRPVCKGRMIEWGPRRAPGPARFIPSHRRVLLLVSAA